MGGMFSIAASVAAAAGVVAAIRYVEKRKRELGDLIDKAKRGGGAPEPVIDFERDPATGVFRPRG